VSTALDLDAFIGEEITLRVLLPEAVDGVTHRSWHGYCSEASWLGADGGLARYRLTLVPFLSFLALRRDAYIFQNKDALAIITELMADYVQANVRFEVTQALRCATSALNRIIKPWRRSGKGNTLQGMVASSNWPGFTHVVPSTSETRR
jgi:uncharacterized protein involved in type VI secretion and phage assembly